MEWERIREWQRVGGHGLREVKVAGARWPEEGQKVWYCMMEPDYTGGSCYIGGRGEFYGFYPCDVDGFGFLNKDSDHRPSSMIQWMRRNARRLDHDVALILHDWEKPGQGKKCKLPDCGLNEGCTGVDYFGGDRGVLGGDVTHWMPDTGQDQPENPVDATIRKANDETTNPEKTIS